MRRLTTWMVAAAMLVVTSMARADLTIEITKGNDSATPIAVVPFENLTGGSLPQDLARIISDDLARSGQFEPIKRDNLIALPGTTQDVFVNDWKRLGASYLVVGQVKNASSGGYSIQYELMDVLGNKRMLGEVITGSDGQLRSRAHYMSDEIFEEITGIRGAFSTKIAYITANGVGDNIRFALYVADSDGHGSQEILASDEPIMSPAWSPDGKKLAYVSFESERPAIYVQELGSGRRAKLTGFRGINGAPAWSPDGRKLAMALSKDGQPEIYVMDIASRKFQRLTNNPAIDTEPDWLPDGSGMVFTSDRAGSPQIYRLDLSGGTERVTFTGNYNSRGRVSPDGETLFMINRSGNGYQVAKQDLKSGRVTSLTDTQWDESPSVAPNGTMVIYATQQGTRGVLGEVSADGRAQFSLPSPQGEVREPAWSPFLN
ncbi:Tol-Pal system beta propeller repeat protein TolB [Cobetia marina]|uniref:Tol-Pal system beta propeller repeat protein TolB n=1 Tax=Cobetia TaxID=204286 RepID=UPI00244B2BA6|nr:MULTISPECIES: Tol-Pal system beta propeller repeat protein TolB [Cobetia]MDH2289689.1 Tol-Pal system beta propeller repeat protein TolB [Cobetia sp. 10Alg 146]MDO6786655.1 Tol-Pal system beta propeller repeat protein TolB [Cobetia marina]